MLFAIALASGVFVPSKEYPRTEDVRLTVEFPGYNASDDSLIEEAKHHCGTTRICIDRQFQARDALITAIVTKQLGIKRALKALKVETVDGHTNWWWAAKRVLDLPPLTEELGFKAGPYRPRSTYTCETYVSYSGSYSRTRCY